MHLLWLAFIEKHSQLMQHIATSLIRHCTLQEAILQMLIQIGLCSHALSECDRPSGRQSILTSKW
jgi:hypothetical protein